VAPHEASYETYSALAIAGFLVGGAIVVGGATLLILDAAEEEIEGDLVLEPSVAIGPDGVGLMMVGRF
jgi:hypothetical protein